MFGLFRKRTDLEKRIDAARDTCSRLKLLFERDAKTSEDAAFLRRHVIDMDRTFVELTDDYNNGKLPYETYIDVINSMCVRIEDMKADFL